MEVPAQTLAEKLSEFSLNLHYKNLAPEVIHEVKRRLIDTLGCALGAWPSQACRIARKVAARSPLAKGAHILGTGIKTTADLAAFANGAAIRYLDYNDTYLSKEPAHPSDNFSAALAVAESANANGKQLIESIVLAYEVQCRLCDAAALRPRGWDHVTYGAFSTALLSAKLWRLSSEQRVHALGLSGNANNALRQTRVGHLSMWKGLAFANVARNGVFAAELAKLGLTGPSPIFEGEKGFMNIVSGEFQMSKMAVEGPFKIMQTYIKYYPVEYHAQSAVQATLNLLKKLPSFSLKQIEAVTILTSEISYEIIGSDPDKWHPQSRETADHSLPYIVSVALMDGEVGLSQFDSQHLKNSALSQLIQKVGVFSDKAHTDAYPEAISNTISVKLPGRLWSEKVDVPKGFPKNKMSDAEIQEKFIRMATPLLSESAISKIIDTIWQLESLHSVSALLSLFQVEDRR